MGVIAAIGKVFKAATGPLGILEDWAKEPLNRWDNQRKQQNLDNDVNRTIREQTGVETVKANLEMKKAQQNAELTIRMQTEINRINAETEQMVKDREFERMQNLAQAVCRYRECLTDLQLNTIRTIGEMNIELRTKAQDLILSKTLEYEALQDKAHLHAEEELTRIIEKFSANERIMDIMISSADKKLAGVIDSTTQFLLSLKDDIQRMNNNIDVITRSGQKFIDTQIARQFGSLSLPNSGQNMYIEDVSKEEIK